MTQQDHDDLWRDFPKTATEFEARFATEVPGMGWFSIITDPTGAVLGLWQSKSV